MRYFILALLCALPTFSCFATEPCFEERMIQSYDLRNWTSQRMALRLIYRMDDYDERHRAAAVLIDGLQAVKEDVKDELEAAGFSPSVADLPSYDLWYVVQDHFRTSNYPLLWTAWRINVIFEDLETLE